MQAAAASLWARLLARELCGADRVPLEGGVRLGREVADGYVDRQVPAPSAALPLQPFNRLGDAQHVGIRLARQAYHEVQLDLFLHSRGRLIS
jgi:hypothetical protein